MIAIGHWNALLAATAALLLTSVAVAENAIRQRQPSLIVTPSTGMDFFRPRGSPFSPPQFQYQVSASTGTINYSITGPTWLTVSPALGAAGTSGVTITFTISTNAMRLAPGTYESGVLFRNVTNGQGFATRGAKLIIEGAPIPSSSTTRRPKGDEEYLQDRFGRFLLDDYGERLLAK